MSFRLNPHHASPKSMEELMSFQEFSAVSGLDPRLLELVRTRVSGLNHCAQGICRYTQRARELGETEERLHLLPAWKQAPLYNAREQAALAWAEAVAQVGTDVTDLDFRSAREWYTEEELVELTVVILATNAWNRMVVSFRHVPSVVFAPLAD
jgi:AhpD family alkylhydroperoxidase